MNVVRSAGGTANSTSYRSERETTPTGTQPIIRPTCSIAELMKKTNFSKDEIRHLYRTFKQDCPSGEVSKTHFSSVFASLFPTGECFRYSLFLFQNIDRLNTGYIRLEDLIITLSILIHGSIEERLSWIFDLYDINKDGILTKAELLQIVASIFQLIVPIRKFNYATINSTIEERTNQLFQNWDIEGNGRVCKADFLRFCLQDEMIQQSMNTLKSSIRL